MSLNETLVAFALGIIFVHPIPYLEIGKLFLLSRNIEVTAYWEREVVELAVLLDGNILLNYMKNGLYLRRVSFPSGSR